MTKGQAIKLGAALVAAGVLDSAQPGNGSQAKASARVQGAATIDGQWAGRDARAGIMCEHVALALIREGRWSVNAIRACAHSWESEA